MSLSVSSFARTYIFHPLSDQLSLKEKVAATVSTVALAILLLGVIYYAGRFCYGKMFKKISPSDTSKIDKAQKDALPTPQKVQPEFNSDLTQFPFPPAERTIPPSQSWHRNSLTLQNWLAKQESVKQYLGAQADIEAISTTINKMIDGFDREFQIKARFAALVKENADWFTKLDLKVWDLEAGFFPFALMMDPEIQKVTLNQVGNRDLTRLQERLEREACRTKLDDTLKVTKDNFRDVPLVQLLNLNSESLNELLPFFPDWMLRCLPSSQIPKINVHILSQHQFQLLFSFPNEETVIWVLQKITTNLQTLNPATQIDAATMLRLGDWTKSLTASQIGPFIKGTRDLSPQLFSLLFPIMKENTREEESLTKRFNSLDVIDILSLFNHLTVSHWKQLNKENFGKIAHNHTEYLLNPVTSTKTTLLEIFHTEHREAFMAWITTLDPKSLAEFRMVFNEAQWRLLTDEQVLEFTKAYPEHLEMKVGDKTLFQILYPESYAHRQRLDKLPLETITRFSTHFSLTHWGYLSLNQKVGVCRETKVEQNVFNAFFPPNGNLLASLPIGTVLELCYRFEEGHWNQLSDAQVRTLTDEHTDKLNLRVGDKTVFQILYPTQFIGYDQSDKKEKIERKVRTFSHETLVSLAPQFKVEHWLMLLDDQVLELTRKRPDLLAVKVENNTVFETLYGWAVYRRLKELTVADISAICPLLQKGHWCELSEEKKTDITNNHQDFFDKNKDAFPALYPTQANVDPERYERISFDALMALSRRFEEGHWIQLSQNLVKRITDERTETLKILVGQKTVFTLFYPVEQNRGMLFGLSPLQTKIQQFPLKAVGELAPLFERQHWEYLSQAQINQLVVSNPALFMSDAMCGIDWLFKKFITTKRDFGSISVSVTALPLESVLVLSPKFTEAHWKALSEAQLQALRIDHSDKLPEFLQEKN